MTELIEKTSYEAKEKELSLLLFSFYEGEEEDEYNSVPAKIKELRALIAKEVELAYKAGMLHFNAFDHTLNIEGSRLKRWVDTDLSVLELGDYVTLPSLYLQAKGFKR